MGRMGTAYKPLKVGDIGFREEVTINQAMPCCFREISHGPLLPAARKTELQSPPGIHPTSGCLDSELVLPGHTPIDTLLAPVCA